MGGILSSIAEYVIPGYVRGMGFGEAVVAFVSRIGKCIGDVFRKIKENFAKLIDSINANVFGIRDIEPVSCATESGVQQKKLLEEERKEKMVELTCYVRDDLTPKFERAAVNKAADLGLVNREEALRLYCGDDQTAPIY